MTHPVLLALGTEKASSLPKQCRIGTDHRNNLVLSGRSVLPHHCVIWKGLFGMWRIRQLDGESHSGPSGARHVPTTKIRRQGRIACLLPNDTSRLRDGDELLFGAPQPGANPTFSHAFRLMR